MTDENVTESDKKNYFCFSVGFDGFWSELLCLKTYENLRFWGIEEPKSLEKYVCSTTSKEQLSKNCFPDQQPNKPIEQFKKQKKQKQTKQLFA